MKILKDNEINSKKDEISVLLVDISTINDLCTLGSKKLEEKQNEFDHYRAIALLVRIFFIFAFCVIQIFLFLCVLYSCFCVYVCVCLFFWHFEPYDRKLKIFFNQFPVSTFLFYFFDFTFLFYLHFFFFFLSSFFSSFFISLFLPFFFLFFFLFCSFFISFLFLFFFLFSFFPFLFYFFFLRISKAKQKVITLQYLNSTDRLTHSHVNLPQPQEIFSENKKKF